MSPVVDIIDVSERTWDGCSIAMVCASHGCADDVCAVEAEGIHQPHRISGHVGEGVRHRRQVAGERRRQVWRRGIRQVCREPDITIIEANQLQAPVSECMAKRVRPRNGLCGDSHDQQHYGRIAIPETLIGDVDLGRPDLEHLLVHNGSIEPID
jgi:hypothetical protein